MGNEMSALRLYLPLARLGKVLDVQKGGLVSASFVSVSGFFLAFGFCLFLFCFSLVAGSGGEFRGSKKKVLGKVAALPFL